MSADTNGQKINFSYIGFQYYSLTWCCFDRQPLFTEHDRVDFATRAAVKYIIENPVRAGLVTRVEDYPFTGSSIHTIEELMKMAYTI